VFDTVSWEQGRNESDLTFAQRMEALIDLLTHFKNRCDKMIKGENFIPTILTPQEAKKTAKNNRNANDERQKSLKTGREMRKNKKSEEEAQSSDQADQKRTKRRAYRKRKNAGKSPCNYQNENLSLTPKVEASPTPTPATTAPATTPVTAPRRNVQAQGTRTNVTTRTPQAPEVPGAAPRRNLDQLQQGARPVHDGRASLSAPGVHGSRTAVPDNNARRRVVQLQQGISPGQNIGPSPGDPRPFDCSTAAPENMSRQRVAQLQQGVSSAQNTGMRPATPVPYPGRTLQYPASHNAQQAPGYGSHRGQVPPNLRGASHGTSYGFPGGRGQPSHTPTYSTTYVSGQPLCPTMSPHPQMFDLQGSSFLGQNQPSASDVLNMPLTQADIDSLRAFEPDQATTEGAGFGNPQIQDEITQFLSNVEYSDSLFAPTSTDNLGFMTASPLLDNNYLQPSTAPGYRSVSLTSAPTTPSQLPTMQFPSATARRRKRGPEDMPFEDDDEGAMDYHKRHRRSR
jgi:hypothetical protein